MALRQSGVDLIVKNFQNFVNNLKAGEQVADKFDKKLDQLQRRFHNIRDTVENSVRSQKNAMVNYNRAVENMANAIDRMARAEKDLNSITEETSPKKQIQIWKEFGKAATALKVAHDNLIKTENNLQSAMVNSAKYMRAKEKAAEDLAKREEELANANGQFADMLANIVPGGNQVMGIIGGIGSLASKAVPILLAVGAAFTTIKVASGIATAAINIFKFAIQAVINIAKGIANAFISGFKAIGSIIDWATRPLRQFVQHVVEIASGIALWRFLRNLGQGFKNIADEIYNATASFQELEIRLDSLVARDVSRGLGIPMREAFEMTTGAAVGLFDWMRKLGIQTKYTVDDIAQFFTMSTAMGITIEKTKELTQATVDFASGMGLSGEVMQRIIYNFGQMIQRGKLSGEEFRDLARNFVPIDQIMRNLAEKAGMTTVAFREMALEGGVPVMEFIQEFIDLSSTDFEGAASRLARTWAGVTSNIKEFMQTFMGMDILKPLLDEVSGMLDDLLQKVLSDERLQRTTKFFGQVLVTAFRYLNPAVDGLVNAIKYLFTVLTGGQNNLAGMHDSMGILADKVDNAGQKIYGFGRTIALVFMTGVVVVRRLIERMSEKIKEFGEGQKSPLSTLVEKAKSFGLNFVRSFSAGISGGLRILTTVIATIANILSTWFKPGSPPKIAPDIDKWGMDTMNEWLRGFTLADFDVFDDVSSLVESYFKSLGDSIADESLIPTILNARDLIGGALAGIGPTNIFGGMIGTGNVSALFQDYMNTLMAMEGAQGVIDAATAEIKRAQDAVDAARRAYDSFDDSIYGVADAERELADASALADAIQSQINTTTEQYDAILESLRKQLTSVTEEYDETIRLREIDNALANERLTADERERLMMEKRAIEIGQQIRATEDQRDVEVDALKAQLSEAKAKEESAKVRLEAIKQEVDAAKQLLQLNIDNAERELESAKARKDAADANLDLLEGHADAVRKQIELIIEQNNFINEQKALLEELAEAQDQVLAQDFTMPDLGPEIDNFQAELDALIADAELAADGLFAAFEEIGNAWESGGAPAALSGLGGAFENLRDVINEAVGADGEGGWLGTLKGTWNFIREKLKVPEGENFIVWLAKKLEELAPDIEAGGKLVLGGAVFVWLAGKKIWNAVSDFFGTDEVTGLPNTGRDLLDFGGNTFKAGILLWQTANRIEQSFPGFKKVFVETVGAILAILAAPIALPMIPFIAVLGGIYTALKTLVDVLPWFTQIITDKIQRISDVISDFLDVFDSVRNGGIAGLDVDALWRFVVQLAGGNIAPAQDFLNSLGVAGYAGGGRFPAGVPFVVGERGPEVMAIDSPGTVFPDVGQFRSMINSMVSAPRVSAPLMAGTGDVDRSINIEINPTYSQVQSEASIYYDLTAALAMVGR